jgi:hypothetical protein
MEGTRERRKIRKYLINFFTTLLYQSFPYAQNYVYRILRLQLWYRQAVQNAY